ncbi:MAG TPA: type II toxin-antitoxin system RelE/ParE family toxin [Roseiarcus sp.]|nr:type II toxin-antitoxin system RelE/ParE family toxin [Roseiarcus sp.]
MKLRYTLRAAQELEQVLSYIDDRSPEGARRVKARIQAVIDLIASHPQSGQLTSARRLRRIVVHPYPYLIFYAATNDEVVIHGVRHAARRPSSMPE